MNRPGSISFRRTGIGLAICFILVLLGVGAWMLASPNRVWVLNSTGVAVTDLVLDLSVDADDWRMTMKAESLEPGDSLLMRHGRNDFASVLRFRLAGEQYEHRHAAIDLWTGDGWRFEIMSGGAVRSGYDAAKSD